MGHLSSGCPRAAQGPQFKIPFPRSFVPRLLIFKCLHQTAPVYLRVMSDPVSASASRSHLRSAAHAAIWRYLDHKRRLTDKEFFRLWSVTVELVATLCS